MLCQNGPGAPDTAPGLPQPQLTDSGLSVFTRLTAIEELNLSDNVNVRDAGVAYLTRLRNLKALNLSYSGKEEIGWRQLSSACVLSDPAALPCCGPCKSIHSSVCVPLLPFACPAAGVSDFGLSHLAALPSLLILNLDSRLVTDRGLEHIRGLTGLEVLDLFGAKVTDAGCAHLR